MRDDSSKKSRGRPVSKFYESEEEPRFSKLMFLVSAISVFWWLGFFLNIAEQTNVQFMVNTVGSIGFTLIAYGLGKSNGTPFIRLLSLGALDSQQYSIFPSQLLNSRVGPRVTVILVSEAFINYIKFVQRVRIKL